MKTRSKILNRMFSIIKKCSNMIRAIDVKKHFLKMKTILRLKPDYFKQQSLFVLFGHDADDMKQFMIKTGQEFIEDDSSNFFMTTLDAIYYLFPITQLTENSFDKLKEFIDKKTGKKINGVILTTSVLDFFEKPKSNLLIQTCGETIEKLCSLYHIRLPIYFIFTDCHQVAGFNETYQFLSYSESEKVLGITFLHNEKSFNYYQDQFDGEKNNYLNQLNVHLTKRLADEKVSDRRMLLHAHENQMSFFLSHLTRQMQYYYHALHLSSKTLMRGFYFTSHTQDNICYDLSALFNDEHHHIDVNSTYATEAGQRQYFIHDLFKNLILGEKKFFGYSLKTLAYKRSFKRSLSYLIPIIVCLILFFLHDVYTEMRNSINHAEPYVSQTSNKYQRRGDELISTSTQALERLNDLSISYQHAIPILGISLIAHHQIKKALESAQLRILQNDVLPRVAADIEHSLRHSNLSTELYYLLANAYHSFSSDGEVDPNSLSPVLPYLYKKSKVTQKEFNIINKMLNDKAKTPVLPVNNKLITKIATKLEWIKPWQKVYDSVKFRAGYTKIAPVSFNYLLGAESEKIYNLPENRLLISNLYSLAFHQQINFMINPMIKTVINHEEKILHNNIAKDESNIRKKVLDLYRNDVIENWKEKLSKIHIREFHNLEQAIQILSLQPRELLQGITQVNHQVAWTKSSFTTELSKYAVQFAQSDEITPVVKKVIQDLKRISHSSDQDEASFTYIKKIYLGELDSPILQLAELSKNAPFPVNTWINELSRNTLQLLINNSHKVIAKAWESQVIRPFYYFTHRFPHDTSSTLDADIMKLTKQFGENGTLSSYFKRYLSPFIISYQDNWKQKKINGISIGLDADVIPQLKRWKSLQSTYFANSLDAKVSLLIKPLNLSRLAKSSQLSFDNLSINYQHGPQINYKLNWPTGSNANLLLTDFNDKQYQIHFEGDWSLFRLFQKGDAQLHAGKMIVTFKRNNLTMQYEISNLPDNFDFNLTQLRRFNLPTFLFPLKAG